MVQLIPANQRQSTGSRLVEGIGRGLNAGQELMKEYQQVKALEKYGIDAQSARALSGEGRNQILTEGLKQDIMTRRAGRTNDINYMGPDNSEIADQLRQGQREQFLQENPLINRKNLPEFGNGMTQQKNKFFPENIGGQEKLGNAPQPETSGIKKKLLTTKELISEGKRIAQEQNASGIPTTALEGYHIAKDIENDKKLYNAEVENDVKQRVESQRNYGNTAVEKLKKVLPTASDDIESVFRKKGEDIATRETSEADINRYLSKEAINFKDTIANIKKSIPPMRIGSKIKSHILGNDRAAEKARDDIRIKLKPLLDEGLYDTSRNLLSELGYHPEEREGILSDLGEGAKKALVEMPNMKKATKLKGPAIANYFEEQPFSDVQNNVIKENMSNVFKNDPASNLILLRKSYEDKGVDWRTFKDNLNDMILSGDVKLNDDQFKMLDTLDQPPLNNLDQILFNFNLIGR